MNRKKEERLQKLRTILDAQGRVRTRDLAASLHVSPETLRSDLDLLESQGLIRREHGYARLSRQDKETPLLWRQSEHRPEKFRIARRALEEVKDGDVVFIDAGSTLLTALDDLSIRKDLTIIVNSLPAASTCLDMGFACIFIGGDLNRNGQHTYGYFAEDMIDHIRIDVAVLGTVGIQGADGFCAYSLKEVGIRRHIIRQAQKLVIIMDAYKTEMPGYYRFATFREADVLITNRLSETQRIQLGEVPRVVEV